MIQVLPNESNNPRNQYTLFACHSDILQQNFFFFNTFFILFLFFPYSSGNMHNLPEECISRHRQIPLEIFHLICYTYEIADIVHR